MKLNDCRDCILGTLELNKKKLHGSGMYGGIMFVGTNPSYRSSKEIVWKDPFGKYFSGQLFAAGINPDKIYFTNIVKCATPKNEPVSEESVLACKKYLAAEIEEVKPKIIIAMGAQAGKWFETKIKEEGLYNDIPVYAIYHPSYIENHASEETREWQTELLKKLWEEAK